MTEVAPCR